MLHLQLPWGQGGTGPSWQWAIIRAPLNHVITALYKTIKMSQILYKCKLSALACQTKNFTNNRILLIWANISVKRGEISPGCKNSMDAFIVDQIFPEEILIQYIFIYSYLSPFLLDFSFSVIKLVQYTLREIQKRTKKISPIVLSFRDSDC